MDYLSLSQIFEFIKNLGILVSFALNTWLFWEKLKLITKRTSIKRNRTRLR